MNNRPDIQFSGNFAEITNMMRMLLDASGANYTVVVRHTDNDNYFLEASSTYASTWIREDQWIDEWIVADNDDNLSMRYTDVIDDPRCTVHYDDNGDLHFTYKGAVSKSED